MKTSLLSLVLLSGFFLSGCATTIDTYYSPQAKDFTIKSIYIVNKDMGSQEMDERLKRNLAQRKLKVVIGPETKKVTSEDAILKYTESWKSDVTNFLQALDILIFDKNGELIASTHWKNSKFNTLSTMNTIVTDSLDTLFEKIKIEEEPAKTP
jgi:hypothetical protein